MSSEFGMQILKLVMTSLRGRRPWQSIVALSILFLVACTDYVSQIEDRNWEWNDGQVPIDPLTVVKGEMTDSRDGQTYKTVTIGSQTWMAQNLNYVTENSYCIEDNTSNCTKYGRLYTWDAAMDSMGTWSANGKGCGYGKNCSPTYPVRGVCPTGWHLPTEAEFKTLFTAVGGPSVAGKKLKSRNGWNNNGNGTDDYSFSALPAGFWIYGGGGGAVGNRASFWSSIDFGEYAAVLMELAYDDASAYLPVTGSKAGYSVRCVKD